MLLQSVQNNWNTPAEHLGELGIRKPRKNFVMSLLYIVIDPII